jgi:hypothetical protein
MQHKIVAQIKGGSYSSISFTIDSTEQLGQIIGLLEGLKCVDDRYSTVDGSVEKTYYESGPLSLTLDTSVAIYTQEEIHGFIAEESRIADEKVEAGESDVRD